MTPPDPAGGSLRMLRTAVHAAADNAVALTAALADTDPADLIALARLQRGFAVQTVIVAVVHARAHDVPWEVVGQKLGMTATDAETVFGGYEERHRAGDPTPWVPIG